MRLPLVIFGIVHWSIFGIMVYLAAFVLEVSWTWILIGVALYMVFFISCVIRILRHFYHFPIPSAMTKFIDNPIRRKFFQQPDRIAERMQLGPGMIVVEIGPGKGSYTKEVAKRVLPGGVVYAIDISENVIARMKKMVNNEKISNIIPKIDDAYGFSFIDESVDRIFAVACLPEIPDQVRVLKECRRILKHDGLISLCELLVDPDYPRRKTEMRWATEAGLELKQAHGNWNAYQLNFGKKR